MQAWRHELLVTLLACASALHHSGSRPSFTTFAEQPMLSQRWSKPRAVSSQRTERQSHHVPALSFLQVKCVILGGLPSKTDKPLMPRTLPAEVLSSNFQLGERSCNHLHPSPPAAALRVVQHSLLHEPVLKAGAASLPAASGA